MSFTVNPCNCVFTCTFHRLLYQNIISIEFERRMLLYEGRLVIVAPSLSMCKLKFVFGHSEARSYNFFRRFYILLPGWHASISECLIRKLSSRYVGIKWISISRLIVIYGVCLFLFTIFHRGMWGRKFFAQTLGDKHGGRNQAYLIKWLLRPQPASLKS